MKREQNVANWGDRNVMKETGRILKYKELKTAIL
jgi:hypothetical protein